MKRMTPFLALLALTVVFSGCDGENKTSPDEAKTSNPYSGNNSGNDQTDITGTPGNSFSYTYSYKVNGCKTGKQTFHSIKELCIGLQNEALNNYCAQSRREVEYRKMCKGNFTPFSDSQFVKNKGATLIAELGMKYHSMSHLEVSSTALLANLGDANRDRIQDMTIECVGPVNTHKVNSTISLIGKSSILLTTNDEGRLVNTHQYECLADKNIIDAKDMKKISLIEGDTFSTTIIVFKKGKKEAHNFIFSCVGEADLYISSKLNGVGLLAGSTIIATESNRESNDLIQISCEKP